MIFLQVILPVLLIFLSGYILQRIFKLDLKPISTLAIYVLTTALVFRTFYKTALDLQLFYIVVISMLLLGALILLTQLTSRWFHYDKQQESAMMLSTAFMNSGNYGTPIILFAYGEAGFNYAVQIMVFHSIIMGVFGVYFASRGKGGVGTAGSVSTVSHRHPGQLLPGDRSRSPGGDSCHHADPGHAAGECFGENV
jgi:predicted permease